MAILHNQKITTKILSILSIILFFNLVVGIVGCYYSKEISRVGEKMYSENLLPIHVMEEVRLSSKDTEMKLATLILTSDPVKQQIIVKEIDENTKHINDSPPKTDSLAKLHFETYRESMNLSLETKKVIAKKH